MDAKKCDRCGAYYDNEKEHARESAFFDQIYKINSFMPLGSNTRKKFDFCPDCRKAFVEFMEGGKQ